MKTVFVRSPSGEVIATRAPENYPDWVNLGGGAKGETERQKYVCSVLRKILKPGQTVYTSLESVAQSGMSRVISVYIVEKGRIRRITHLVAEACDMTMVDKGLRVAGCGMDMGFSVVYNLGSALWPNGTRKPHGSRNGESDKTGGYALKHEWI